MTTEISSEIKDWIRKEESYIKKTIQKNSIIFDVGCCFGRAIKLVAKEAKLVIGIDKSRAAIKKAKENLSKFNNVKLFVENAKKTHFEDNFFNYIICTANTLGNMIDAENLEDVRINALKEMKRVVKHGGKILASVYSENALRERIKDYTIKSGLNILKIDENGTVFTKEGLITTQFTKKQLNDLFTESGLNCKITKLNDIAYMCEAVVKK